jgi:hypothetical protein
MQRGSDKHGPRLDEAMERETRGLVQGGRDPHAEEWKQPEPSGEDQPDIDLVPHGSLHGGVPDGLTDADVEQRSELAALLGKEIWPAETEQVRARARESNARQAVLDRLAALPAGRVYLNLAEVWADLGGGNEQHRF